MAAKHISVKVFFMVNDVSKEIRKFSLDKDVACNYEYLIGRIKVFFTSLIEKDLLLYWKDGEGDYISISSDTELIELIKSVNDDADHLKLYIKEMGCNGVPMNNHHDGIVCDGCENKINGIRYKCTSCPDFDLCSSCESTQNHPLNHDMLCIKTPHRRTGSFPWMRMRKSPYYFASPKGCPFKQSKSACSKESKNDSEAGRGTRCEEFVQQMAASFGLDPEVALSQAQSFLDNVFVHPTAECNNQNGDAQETKSDVEMKEMHSEEAHDTAKHENMQPPQCGNTETGKDSLKSNDTVAMDTLSVDDKKEPKASSSKQTDGNSFLNQMGIDSELPKDQLGSLGQIIGSVMENIGNNLNLQPRDDKVESTGQLKSVRPEDFVYVKSTKDKMSKEELYEVRLSEALHQMESMGFDNDGGWLKQLLITKGLDITKVIDALNPPKN